ncbi:MAG TPA: tetratricopeptide repeat protein, partial [Caldilineaceae bacterium]|nr:tetratricopeptide repeat protein [Caldilineaceae bacterium]
FPDGIWFVSLAALQAEEGDRATAIALAIGSALGVLFQGHRSVNAQLLTLLAPRRALLLLDNIEQLIEPDGAAAAGVIDFIIALLEAAPHLHLLVTSRIALDLNSEFILRLPGLPVPAADLPEDAADYTSIQLFAERAGRIAADLRLEQQLGEIAAICRLVAGLPLAIELAAAWSGSLTPMEILLALQENLDFLASRRRDIPARQRSMRAVFDHSWQLLSPTAQAVLAQIACFTGGFTVEAARAILAVARPQPTSAAAEDPVVAILDSLCQHALLHQDEMGRYTIHALLRDYAAEQLTVLTEQDQAATPALSGVTQRYRRYYLAFVNQATARGWYTRAALMPIQRDLPNIRQAWQTAIAHGDLAGLALGWRGLWHIYRSNALFQEGEELFGAALVGVQAATPPTADVLRLAAQLQVAHAAFLNAIGRYSEAVAGAQNSAAFVETVQDDLLKAETYAVWGTGLYRQGQTHAAQKVLEQGLAAAQGAGAPLIEAQIQRRLGNTRQATHDFAQAQTHYEAALALFRQHDHRPGEGETLTGLGWCSQQQHDLAQALDYLQQAAQIQRAIDNAHGESMALINLATVHEQAGDYNRAYACRQQVLKLLDHFDDPYQRVLVNHGLGVLLSRLGDYAAAEPYLLRALAMDQALGDPAGVAWTQLNLGLVYNRRGEVARGLALHQAALQSSIALGARTIQGLAWARLGQDYYALGEWEEAYEAYVQAIALQTELGQRIWVIEAQSGLAATQLALNLRAEALAQVEAILDHLAPEALDSAREPMQIYWNCYQVLAALSDPRAGDLLRSANQQLNAQAATFTDAAWPHTFLHNVDAHRMLRQEYGRIA